MSKLVWVRACLLSRRGYIIYDHRQSIGVRYMQRDPKTGLFRFQVYMNPHVKVLVAEDHIPQSARARKAAKLARRQRSREIRRAWRARKEQDTRPISERTWDIVFDPHSGRRVSITPTSTGLTTMWRPSVTWTGPGVELWQ